MSQATLAPTLETKAADRPHSTTPLGKRTRGYLFGPWLDMLFLANLYWPLLFLGAHWGGAEVQGSVLFWQVYFITAPHRWITLLLVACDRDKTRDREWKFLGLAAVVILGCLFWQANSAALLCLGTIDYLWNAWHFASQHHGIHRIYVRTAGHTSDWHAGLAEKLLFRGFLLYVIARVAGFGWSGSEWLDGWTATRLDPWMAIIPCVLILQHLLSFRQRGFSGGTLYLISVLSLFSAMLLAAHWENRTLTIQLAICSAIFHAMEYMAIVTWASTSERNRTRADLFGRLARTWGLFLGFFVIFLGVSNYILAHGDPQKWILINLMVAFLHYGYDGMIWKSRIKKKAQQA